MKLCSVNGYMLHEHPLCSKYLCTDFTQSCRSGLDSGLGDMPSLMNTFILIMLFSQILVADLRGRFRPPIGEKESKKIR